MNILVLEDDPAVMSVIRLSLQRLGHTLLEAGTADEAFQRFEENDAQIDLLLADVTLPVSSGIRVALELRSLLPNMRIILTSGYPASMWNDQDAAELSELPSDSVSTLQKPFAPSALREAVCRFLPSAARVATAPQTAVAPGD